MAGRGQKSRGGGGIHRIVHKVEVTADKRGEAPSNSHHVVHKLALNSVLVATREKIAVEDQESLVRIVDGGVLPALDIAAALWESDVRPVHYKSARYIS